MRHFNWFFAQNSHWSQIYKNIIMNLRIIELETWPFWRTTSENSCYKAWQWLKSLLQCLLKWLMVNWMLQHTRNQLNLQTPWMLQASCTVKYGTICFNFTFKSPQKHLMSMNPTREMACVWENWKFLLREKFEKFLDLDLKWMPLMKAVVFNLIYPMLILLKSCLSQMQLRLTKCKVYESIGIFTSCTSCMREQYQHKAQNHLK